MKVVCYGIIPVRSTYEGWQCFLIQHRRDSFWGFPKGHVEGDEKPLETAKRELLEETCLIMTSLHDEVPIEHVYKYQEEGEWVDKTVYFYLAKVSGTSVMNPPEVLQGLWCSLSEAEEKISYPEGKKLVQELKKRLR